MAAVGQAHLMESNGTKGELRSRNDILGFLIEPNPLADLILGVEGHLLYTSKYLLASASSKFQDIIMDSSDGRRHFLAPSVHCQSIFHQPHRERRRHSYPLSCAHDTTYAAIGVAPNILPLPDLSLNDVINMLRWLLPTETLQISAENVESILNLAKDYGIEKLLEACDWYFYEKLESSTRKEDFMEYVALTEQYGLSVANELAFNHLSLLTTKELRSLRDSMGVTARAMAEIYERRSELLESGSLAQGNANRPDNFILVVGDQEVLAPSAALATASDVLKAMMESDFLERRTGRINMPGKSLEVVKFMVEFISSTDPVPIPDELLVECIGLADEYMLGRLKHTCIQYMSSKANELQLNECLLYLQLVNKYQLSGLEEQILNLMYARSTADILQCANYETSSTAPLLLKRAQWLETELVRYQKRIGDILSQAMKLYSDVDKGVRKMLDSLTTAMTGSNLEKQECGNGHTISKYPRKGRDYGPEYFMSCPNCALLSRKQFREKLDIAKRNKSVEIIETRLINGDKHVQKTETDFSWPCFSNEMKLKFEQLKLL